MLATENFISSGIIRKLKCMCGKCRSRGTRRKKVDVEHSSETDLKIRPGDEDYTIRMERPATKSPRAEQYHEAKLHIKALEEKVKGCDEDSDSAYHDYVPPN